MTTWILILVVRSGYSANSPVAVTHIPGFVTPDECETAAKSARDQLGDYVRTACVKQPKP